MDTEKSSDAGFGAFLLGLAVGVGVGLLFAPRSGERTRRLIADTTREGMDRAAGAVEDARVQIKTGLANAEEAAQQFRNRVEETVTNFKDRVEHAVRAGQEAYRKDLEEHQAEEQGSSSRAATSGS